jgi:hypothetical protein
MADVRALAALQRRDPTGSSALNCATIYRIRYSAITTRNP